MATPSISIQLAAQVRGTILAEYSQMAAMLVPFKLSSTAKLKIEGCCPFAARASPGSYKIKLTHARPTVSKDKNIL